MKRGLSEEQIVETYVETYGRDILALTEDSPLAVMSWSLPYALISFGLALVVLIAVRLVKRGPRVRATEAVTDDDHRLLDRALEDLD